MKKLMSFNCALALTLSAALATQTDAGGAGGAADTARGTWTAERAHSWYARQPWLVGANFIPSTAINQLEMFQADTFDPETIDRELGWAKSLGFTSVRVFLHHLLWEQDKEGFLERLDQYLAIADKHGIGTMFVLFDSVWDPEPKLGKQREPLKGLHNSGWVQSPGKHDLMDAGRHKLLEEYVKGVVGRFKDDKRVQIWDVWNEPDNLNGNSYGEQKLKTELPREHKQNAVRALLPKTFAWAREAGATQPLTSGLWLGGHKADPAKLIPIEKVQLENSDVVSFHTYENLDGTKTWVEQLRAHGRPLICTEFLARPQGSTFDPILRYFMEQRIGAYCWGFVAGKTNTIYPWDSWQKPYPKEPPVWFHDIFRPDGTPITAEEVEYIREVTGDAKSKPPAPVADAEPLPAGSILQKIQDRTGPGAELPAVDEDEARQIKKFWARIQLDTKRLHALAEQGDQVPVDYRQSLQDHVRVLDRVYLPTTPGPEKVELCEVVTNDLKVKADFGEANRDDPWQPVKVTVRTFVDGMEVKGLQVWFVPAGWKSERTARRAFEELSTPTTRPLRPGSYYIWSPGEADSKVWMRVDIGEHGQLVKTVNLVVSKAKED